MPAVRALAVVMVAKGKDLWLLSQLDSHLW